MKFYLFVIINFLPIITVIIETNEVKNSNESNIYTNSSNNLFSARIVGIFVADSELPYTLELAKPSIEIAIKKVV